ncbi:bifunctional diguanylate cyclase/phosphodiesterase [Erythrobacter sp. HKB08]|uniref:putative bifunctional diguanylate cyclase/phosphodiesterase n=1 Tax=Erythrobacter sp. HKB08 TaxID=2502843 RepID=UPI001008C9E1|nr:EAL domain-containing protein [Erythrobacter sp. HKB08]
MAKARIVKQVRKGLIRLMHDDALTERVRRTLVRTLYTQPSSLALGAAAGIVASSIVAYQSGSTGIIILTVALTVVAIARVAAGIGLSPDKTHRSTRQLEILYEIGAFTYSFLLGTIAALTLLIDAGATLKVAIVANALCYGVGICGRNAGRPSIALGQLILVCAPIFTVCLIIGDAPLLFLGATIILLIPAMASIMLNIFKVLRDSIASAEESERMAEKMRILARTDVVTGLANRAGLNHEIVERLTQIADDQMLAVFWVDLDRFKEVNDLLGHPVGDRVLVETARRLKEVTPDEASVARFGGDEFVIFCEVENRRECEKLASEIHAEIMRPIRLDGDRMEVGASIGIAMLPDDGLDADTLMQNADLALYHAKVNGRKQTCFYHTSMSRDLVRRREIEAELRAAILKDELSIFFQPIVDLETGKIRTFEALVRWFHPEKGELRPDEFIPVAEETGVIVTLGNWITTQAAKAAAQWPEDVTVAVNLSPLQIKAPGAALGIINALRNAGLDPKRLELEVTESVFLDDDNATEYFIEDLSKEGIRFALDDFGTGYSSLSYIHKYPFKKIKVDRSFVSGPDVGTKSDAIIRAVAELGSKLDMDIVAEGIETVEQVEIVRDAGCTLGQGYHFSRAVPDYLATMLLAKERGEDGPSKAVA